MQDNKEEYFENPNEAENLLDREEEQKESKINFSASIVDSQDNKQTFAQAVKQSLVQPGTVTEGNNLFEQIFRLISYNDVSGLRQQLQKEGESLNLLSIRDDRKFTVLAYSAYKNFDECFMILYNHALEVNLQNLKADQKQQAISLLVNSPTDEEFTPLHFATYHGNFKLIKFLVENANADIYKRNKFGSSVLHIAAQGDQAMPIYYFTKKGMDINLRDERQSTPLHWACYSKAEVALNYILSLNPDLEAQDEKGLTSLHLAVKSVESLKSTRPVRALLLRGADRLTKDKEGKMAIDMIGDKVPDPLKKDLKSILRKPSYWECLMIKTPLVALKPNHKTQVTFWVLMFICYFTLWFILFPNLPVWYYALSTTMVGIKIFIPYIMATRKDPGILKADPDLDFLELLEKFDATDLCPDCKVIRTRRSRHCAICNVCVERFDHHCPWINNCVGVGNHAQYITFMTFIWVLALLVMCITMDCLGRGVSKDPSKNPLGVFCLFGICNVKILQMTVGFFDLIVSTILFIPATLLVYIHYKNFSLGKTTNERFSKKATSSFASQDLLSSRDTETESVRESLVADEEFAQPLNKNSKKIPKKQPKKRSCCQNWKHMMYDKTIATQKELYEKQVRRLERESKSMTQIVAEIEKIQKKVDE